MDDGVISMKIIRLINSLNIEVSSQIYDSITKDIGFYIPPELLTETGLSSVFNQLQEDLGDF